MIMTLLLPALETLIYTAQSTQSLLPTWGFSCLSPCIYSIMQHIIDLFVHGHSLKYQLLKSKYRRRKNILEDSPLSFYGLEAILVN